MCVHVYKNQCVYVSVWLCLCVEFMSVKKKEKKVEIMMIIIICGSGGLVVVMDWG